MERYIDSFNFYCVLHNIINELFEIWVGLAYLSLPPMVLSWSVTFKPQVCSPSDYFPVSFVH